MKRSEDAMEKVLAGLRNVEAPDGMERRILSALDALEDEAPVGMRSGWSWLRPMWLERPMVTRTLVCGVALAGVVAAVFVIPAFRRTEHVPVQSKIDSPSTGLVPLAVSAAVAEIAPLPATRAAVQAARKTDATVTARTNDSKSDSATDSDSSLALSEMRAASHPAPPMPLTEQERLLLRIVHKDDPVEMAVLNPARRAARDAEDQAEFQMFFGAAAGQSGAETPKVEQPATEEPTMEQPATEHPATERPGSGSVRQLPQGLKPVFMESIYGTAEAVPLTKPN